MKNEIKKNIQFATAFCFVGLGTIAWTGKTNTVSVQQNDLVESTWNGVCGSAGQPGAPVTLSWNNDTTNRSETALLGSCGVLSDAVPAVCYAAAVGNASCYQDVDCNGGSEHLGTVFLLTSNTNTWDDNLNTTLEDCTNNGGKSVRVSFGPWLTTARPVAYPAADSHNHVLPLAGCIMNSHPFVCLNL